MERCRLFLSPSLLSDLYTNLLGAACLEEFSAPVRVCISDMSVFCWSNGNENDARILEYRSPRPVSIRVYLATFGLFRLGGLVLSVVIGFIALPPHPFLLVISLPLVLIQIY